MRRAKLASLVASLAFLPAIAVAQTREITGRVTQSEVGTPIAEATVGILGAQQGVRTNAGGEYRLRVPSGDIQVLVRAIGYKRQTRLIPSATSTADFVLEKDVLQLEGVTVTGQATTVDRRNASTAIASVSAEELVVAPAKSLEGNLSGKVVGAAIFENSGVPGGGMQIQIRGATSILGSGDPLYVVDGVIVSNQSVASGLASVTHSSGSTNSTQDQTVNRLADINPNDIENIEVLKSAAASAIYGSRATNGVVVITTKRGRSGQTRYNVTQRVGSEQATRLLSSRHFASYADVQPYLGGSAHADSLAKANCSPVCPWYDWQGQLYNVHSPSFETLMSSSGGFNNTKFFASLNDRQTPGVEQNTGARLTSGRLNLDQTVGEKFVVSGSVDVSHDLTHDGFGNNDNSGTSPIYTFGYAPAIYNLNSIDPVTGRPINMWMNGGGNGTSNPFDVVHAVLNSEETWRQIGNVRLDYSAMSSVHHTIDLHYIGGVDRFQFTGNQYSPNYLQFESADGFLGTSQINTTESFGINESLNGVWTFSPGKKWLNSAQTSAGLAYGSSHVRNYFVRERGLTPTRQSATAGTDIATGDVITDFRDQGHYLNEQVIALDEKLALSAGIRDDRGSANGDRAKFYPFPKYSASYRFTDPLSFLTNKIDEVKFRASYGQSGNRPNYGVRDITISSGGVIGGANSLVASGTVGNPTIKPEVMNEAEFGVDGALFRGRVSFEASRYNRIIKDLLVTYPLAPSSGLAQETVNGGTMSSRGFEAGISIVPISTRDMEWTLRTTFQHNVEYIDKLTVPSFNAPGGSFGNTYGRNRIVQGMRPTLIWGNVPYTCVNTTDASGKLVVGTGSDGQPCHREYPGQTLIAGTVTRDSVIADAAPLGQTSFLNTFRYKALTLTALLDWRVRGYTADMTKNLFDEGGNSRDYDSSSPTTGAVLGAYRYNTWSAGDLAPYIDAGTFVKLREINISVQAPRRWANLAHANDMRISLQGRNLYMNSNYWSFDPEFNNFGNQNFNRFIDLAPYPTNRQFFFSVDLGY